MAFLDRQNHLGWVRYRALIHVIGGITTRKGRVVHGQQIRGRSLNSRGQAAQQHSREYGVLL